MTRQEIARIREAIIAAAIVRQTWDRMDEGRGPPDDDDMLDFIGEGVAVADQFAEVSVKTKGERG